MLDFVFKYKWYIRIFSFWIGLGLIYLDWKFISKYYCSPIQWTVSFVVIFIMLVCHSIVEEEDEDISPPLVSNKNMDYDKLSTNHEYNEDATQCYKSMDKAYFSFDNGTDFDYFLNGLQNKVNAYREMRNK